jgi:hypothetical protein
MRKINKSITSAIILFLILTTFTQPFAMAFESYDVINLELTQETYFDERASQFISRQHVRINADGGGRISVWFEITGTRTMDRIGATSVEIFEWDGSSWRTVRTVSAGLLGSNTSFHSGSVVHQGVAGRSYFARVNLVAEVGGQGDSRLRQTDSIVAR